MSAQPIAPDRLDEIAAQCTSECLTPNPYAGTPTEILLDTLEHLYDQGQEFIPELVFELANRLMVAEGLAIPEPER